MRSTHSQRAESPTSRKRRPAQGASAALRPARTAPPALACALLLTLLLSSLAVTEVRVADARALAASEDNIKEVIPDRFRKRYKTWKKEFLSTEAGREQWERYALNRDIALTITVSEERGEGAATNQYRWDDNGKLVAVTISLGSQIDSGYPSPVNYPVLNSLAPMESAPHVSGSVLAATKLAHEFGHVNRAANTDGKLFQLQDQLIPTYNAIFFQKGRNVSDPQLVALARQMGGTPVEIGRDRELWAEANALAYLRERYPERGMYEPVFKEIRRTVEEYAKEHIERFR